MRENLANYHKQNSLYRHSVLIGMDERLARERNAGKVSIV